MVKTIRAMARGTALAALVCGAHAQSDLVVLPAASTAWRIIAVDGESQAQLTGDSLVAGPLGVTAQGRAGVRDAVLFDWKDRWEAVLRFESPQPLDLRPFVARGTLEFDLDVAELAHGAIRVKLSCAEGCEPSVNIHEQGRAWVGKGWQHVSLPISCFAREGADFSRVKLPFGLVGVGSGRARVANVRILREGKPNTDCPDYRSESVTPIVQNEWWALDWWMSRHQEKLEEKRKLVAAGTPPEIVFIGDSITQGWETAGREVWQRHYAKHHALDLGFNGDRTENVLWRLQHGAIDGIAAKVAVLMIGTNNSGHRAENPWTTAAGIRRIVDEIHRRTPGTRVLLLAIFPRGEQPGDFLRGINERVNRLIAGWSDVRFLNINAELLNADGRLSKDVMPDLLHPNEKGYAIWQRTMEPTLQKLLQTSPD
ncbi:MAG TPA: GDSL-type esterase/lipase family protein [Albitalea sp.]|uniref:putative glycoside hydrolase n=1 Tax=Piscinibacter sp. TaxID=1903157 RepID=UPI002ED09EF4